MKRLALTVLGMLLLATAAAAQCVPLSEMGTLYTQDFNTLGNTGTANNYLPWGWYLYETGTNANIYYRADAGTGTTGDTYSYGAVGSTDRAFGTLLSGSLTPTIGACFTNNTGATILSLMISYTGEQWRQGYANRQDRLDFQYSLDATSLSTGTWIDENGLDFLAPHSGTVTGAYDGNAAGNRGGVGYLISGLSIPPGATFWIRWTDFNATNSDDGLAVDDFSLTPESQATPTLPCTWGTVKGIYR